MVKLIPADSKKLLKLFEETPEIIHKDDKWFVPPFPGTITKMFSKKSPFAEFLELYPFLAEKNGKIVGRIAAIVNRRHNEYYKDKVGFFGFFDFTDDEEVVNALLEKAQTILKEKGLTSMRGPFSPTINDECGLLVEGFDSSPMVMMSYNPAYYVGRYDKVGLKKARDLYAYYIDGQIALSGRIEKIVNRIKKNTGITTRPVNMKNLHEEFKIVHEVYNRTLDRNWSFLPITMEDLEAAAADLKPIADPALVKFAEKDGKPVGYSLCLPDINELMWRVKDSKGLIRILRFLWQLKTKRPANARVIALGVLPEYQGKGIAALFYYDLLVVGGAKFKGGELSWVEESNEEIIKAITVMGAEKYKTYRLYEQSLV